jgi:hypothetical protein
MIRRLGSIAALLLLAVPASAHRLDEYLQAAIISVGSRHATIFLRLAPGAVVTPAVLAAMDIDRDGSISSKEVDAYVQSVLHDISLKVDGKPVALKPISFHFPSIEEMQDGMGEIQISLMADLPRHTGERTLLYENHHRPDISVYMVNAVVPSEKGISIAGQERSPDQASYKLRFVTAVSDPAPDHILSRWIRFTVLGAAGACAIFFLVAVLGRRTLRGVA